MVGVIPTITVIILNISGLKVPMKNQIVNVDKKIRPGSVLLQETHCKYKDTYNLKVNGLRKLFQAKTNEKKTGITILISDRVNIKAKKVIRDKEGYNNKGIISARRHNNHYYVCTQQQSIKLHEANSDVTARRNT